MDRASARTGHFAVGDRVKVIARGGADVYTLAGIATYGGADNAAGAQVVAFEASTAARVLGTAGRYDSIDVVASDGVSQATIAARLRSALGSDVEVLTGAEAAADAKAATSESLGFLSMFLMVFAIVALLVGSFVIFNTFSITVAQRTREHALLRAIGAKRRQVMRAVILEAALTGLVASAAGVAAGILTATGLKAALTSFGMDLPAGGMVVAPRTIVVSVLVGTIVTVVSARFPARRAGKVPPIAALRDVAVDRTGSSWGRLVLGLLVTAGGAAMIASGLSAAEVGPVGLGAVAVFVGVAMLGPVIARPLVRLIGAPLPRLRGIAGTLARENAARNPRRTAATASALMIGIGLVAFITVFAASTKASVNASIETSMRSDWIIETAWGMGGVTPAATARIDALPETSIVTPLRHAPVEVDGHSIIMTAFDPKYVPEAMDLDAVAGSLERLGPSDLAVSKNVADEKGWSVGTTVPLTFADSGTKSFTVAAIFDVLGPTSGYAVSLPALEANVRDQIDTYVLVDAAPGVSHKQARAAIERVLDEYPNASLRTKDEFKGVIAGQINRMLNLVYVLLLMALVIALFGIANTLALSVFERTREIGLLRAVGASRSRIRSTVRWESVLIALLGTGLGSVIGIAFGAALVNAMASQGIDHFAIPTMQLLTIAVFAVLASVVVAALPARRAARMDVLAAIAS